MAYASNIRKGNVIKLKEKLYSVFDFQHSTPGNLRAFVQVKLKDVETGTMTNHRFSANEKVDFVRLEERTMEFIYEEDGKYHFMDIETYEQIFLTAEHIGDYVNFIVPQIKFKVYFYNEKPITAEPPLKVEMKVISTEPGLKGDTVSGASKPATLESNLVINVPLFINTDDIVSVDTRTKQYVERISKAK